MNEANLRAENSGLWFSPEPEAPREGRSPDSVLFDLSKVATPSAAAPAPQPAARRHDATGSGLIDVRTLAAAANDPNGEPPPVARPVTLLPTLISPVTAEAIVPTVVEPPRIMLLAVLGLLGTLVALLAYLALG